MKSLAINLAAAWTATIQSFIDGDVFRESNIDLQIASIADRLGYLKTTVDGKASLAGSNTWTGGNSWIPSSPGQTIGGTFYRELWCVDPTTNATEAAKSGLMERVHNFADANETVNPDADNFRVPQTTANRTYKIGPHAGNNGRTITITRPRATDAHTITIQDQTSTTVCVMPVSAAAWVKLRYNGASPTANWQFVAGSSNLTSINPDV